MTEPAELVSLLQSFHPTLPQELTLLLRPYRIAIRDHATLKATYASHPQLWPSLKAVWVIAADALEDGDQAVPEKIVTLAAFLASLCAGENEVQDAAMEWIEPSLRKIMLYASSFHDLSNELYIPMTRICTQLLSNLITSNPSLASTYWPQRLEWEEKDQLLSRILATSDKGTLQALIIFLINITSSSPDRAHLLATHPAGASILDRLLSQASLLFESETQEGIEGEEFESDVFALTYSLIRQLLLLGSFPSAYSSQSTISSFTICDSQLTLLKFLDSYLSLPSSPTSLHSLLSTLPTFLIDLLKSFSESLKSKEGKLDARDAATVQGCILGIAGLTSIGLAGGEDESEGEVGEGRRATVESVEAVTELLRFSNSLTSTLSLSSQSSSSNSDENETPVEPQSLSLLKLSSVRLLGIAAYHQPLAQDRIRECGGLNELLNCCRIDDRNPTLREHGLFAVRNVLKGNLKNQELIEGMTPQFVVGPQGELQDLPPALRPGGER